MNGFPVCETRDASEILEAIMLRKQTQSNPLFAGVLRWLAGDCVQALQVWHAIDKSNVNDSAIKRDAERALALGYAELGDWEQVLEYLRKTDGADFAREVGNRAVRASDLEQAANWYSISFEIDANFDNAQRLINALTPLGRQQEIINTWQALAARSPAGSLASWLGLAKAAEARDTCPDAISFYRKAIDLQPDSTSALMSLAGVLRHCGDFDGAFRSYLQVAELSPGNEYVLAHVGIAAYENNDFANANQFLQQSVAVQPNALALEYLSRLAFDQGRIESAIQYMRDAVQMSERGDLYLRLGDLLAADGSTQEAEQAYRHSLELQPDNNPALERLGSLVAP
ncbi:MAG: tetratricopeptide repeat protein [Anaerolineae bacterium]